MIAKTIICPFTIVIDSAESQPFEFQGIRADAAKKNAEIIVPTVWECLGRYPFSRGDYSIVGYQGRVGIERKSVEDCIGTVLGWGERRERFAGELSVLAGMESACVIVEGSLGGCLEQMHDRGAKLIEANRKSFHRSIIALQQDYRVPWIFCDSRRLAEVTAFRWFERFWKRAMKGIV